MLDFALFKVLNLLTLVHKTVHYDKVDGIKIQNPWQIDKIQTTSTIYQKLLYGQHFVAAQKIRLKKLDIYFVLKKLNL